MAGPHLDSGTRHVDAPAAVGRWTKSEFANLRASLTSRQLIHQQYRLARVSQCPAGEAHGDVHGRQVNA